MTTEFVLMMAELMPEKMLLEELRKALSEYEIRNTEDSKQKLGTMCFLFITKLSTKDRDIFEVAKEVKDIQAIRDRMEWKGKKKLTTDENHCCRGKEFY